MRWGDQEAGNTKQETGGRIQETGNGKQDSGFGGGSWDKGIICRAGLSGKVTKGAASLTEHPSTKWS
jgi:hypothetical protein